MIGAFPIPERKSVPLISKLPIPQIQSRHGLHWLGSPKKCSWKRVQWTTTKPKNVRRLSIWLCLKIGYTIPTHGFSSWSSFFQLSWCNINWLTSIFEAFSLAGSSHHEDCKTGCFRNLTGMVNQKTKLLLFRKQRVLVGQAASYHLS